MFKEMKGVQNLNEQLIDKDWHDSQKNELIQCLREGESLQKIMEVFPGIKEAFEHPLDTIDCSDGRVLDGKKVGIAGSGILLSETEKAAFVSQFKGKIKTLTTHADCGAAALKFNTLNPNEIPNGVENSDQYGTYCGKKLAEELGAEHIYLGRDKMSSHHHNEMAVVIDQTGQFDSTNLKDFPPHFVCTGAGLGFSEEYVKEETKVLAGIALGHHGFGERFDESNPFIIMVAANNSEELLKWQSIAEEAVSEYGGRVVVKGFVRPDSAEKN